MGSELHTLDDHINRQDDPYGNPLSTFYYAQTQDLSYTLEVDVEVLVNYISLELVF